MDYIKWIRSRVGHECIILNFSGCIIFDKDKRILLQRRRDKNKWGFLGGAVELGESLSETAVREVAEESGLIVEIEELFGVYSKYFDEYPSGDKAQSITTVFTCHIIGGELIECNDETLELAFFDLDYVPELVNQQHEDILNDIRSNKKHIYR